MVIQENTGRQRESSGRGKGNRIQWCGNVAEGNGGAGTKGQLWLGGKEGRVRCKEKREEEKKEVSVGSSRATSSEAEDDAVWL